jgi:hypothetical protein
MIVGRRALQHAGHKVATFRKSIQGPWSSHMWDNTPKHEVLQFKDMPEHGLTQENVGVKRKNVKRNLPKTYYRTYRRTNTQFNKL